MSSLREAADRARQALEVYVPAVRDGSDRGLFAAVNRFAYEYLEAQYRVAESDLSYWTIVGGGFN